jgi:hypothetical protein
MRTTIAFALLAATACGGGGGTDIEATLRFADRTDPEIVRLINAAAGTDMFMAEGQIDQFGDTFDSDPCPSITVSGNTATVTGGCTRLDGLQIQGSATVTNPLGWDQIEDYEYGSDTVYEATQFALIDANFTQTFDGVIRRGDNLTSWDADITVMMWDLTLRSDLYYVCSNPSAPRCTLSGSGLELPGIGGAHVSGTVTVNLDTNRQTSSFTLQGADRLTVSSDGICVAWSISGTDRGMSCP